MSTKNNWKLNLMAIAAAVTAMTATASAQQTSLQATIPFAFSLSDGTHLGPGTYVIVHTDSVWRFRSYDSDQVASTVGYSALEDQASQNPSLTFVCLREKCQIRAIHPGGGARGAEMPAPKLSKSDKKELALVNVPLGPYKSNASAH